MRSPDEGAIGTVRLLLRARADALATWSRLSAAEWAEREGNEMLADRLDEEVGVRRRSKPRPTHMNWQLWPVIGMAWQLKTSQPALCAQPIWSSACMRCSAPHGACGYAPRLPPVWPPLLRLYALADSCVRP